ncbi:MAG TPA: hypothetical protein PLU50_03700 [Pseudobdellovibrionaceae bacterium]|nr:hypothetical protein [Pseudobdellovibrionaceae bacterium]
MNETHPFAVQMTEHAQILSLLGEAQGFWREHSVVDFEQKFQSFVNLLFAHHEAELQVLFQPMEHQPRLKEGGPMCSYFFDTRMNLSPINMVEAFVRKCGQAQYKVLVPNNLMSYFQDNSPLWIPLEEHVAIHAIATFVRDHFKEIPPKKVAEALDMLQSFCSQNFRKEDSCLFEFAKQVLHPR